MLRKLGVGEGPICHCYGCLWMVTVTALEICKITVRNTKVGGSLILTDFMGKDTWCSLFKPQGNASDPGRKGMVDSCLRAPEGSSAWEHWLLMKPSAGGAIGKPWAFE